MSPAPEKKKLTIEEVVSKGFRTKDEESRASARKAVQTYLKEVAKRHVQPASVVDQMKEVNAQISELDRQLTAQLNLVLHDPAFLKLEGSWRGLHYLVHQSNTNPELQIAMMNVSKKDLLNDFKNMTEFDQGGLFKKIYEEQFGTAGGKPYGLMIGDYEFSNHPEDIFLLEKISNVAAAAWCPFITAPSPKLFDMESWEELSNPRDLSMIFEKDPRWVKWKEFRNSEDSRFVGMAMPRVLTRSPYGKESSPIDSFDFEEDVTGEQHERYCWSSAAYAFGSRVTDAFDRYGWTTSIIGTESGGCVEGLPLHVFKSDTGELAAKCPTEIAITDRRDRELDKLGFIPLCHYKDTDYAVFFAAESAQKPKEYDLPAATANANLSAQLPYMFAASRFAHYLKVIQRDKLGRFMSKENVQKFLNDWIMQYVLLNDDAGHEAKAARPLREAKIEVTEIAGRPGCYNAVFWMRPHFQLKEINNSLRMVASLDRPARDAQ